MKMSLCLAALVSALAGSASAGVLTYSASTAGGPQWNRPVGMSPGISSLGPVRYHVCQIRVSQNGAYSFLSEQNFDGYLFLYQGSFDPNAPLINRVGANDDGPTIGLSRLDAVAMVAGVDYFIITTGFELGEEGNFTNTVRGDGEITKVPAPGALAMAGLGGLIAARRRRS